MSRFPSLLLLLPLCAGAQSAPASAAASAPASTSAPASAPAALEPGMRVPEVRGTALDGKPVDGAALRKDRPLLLVFWASWCGPCLEEAPHLRALADRYRDRLAILGIAAGEGETAEDARRFAVKLRQRWPTIHDADNALAIRYRIEMIPQMLLIAPDGTLVMRSMSLGTIEKALAEKWPPPPPPIAKPRRKAPTKRPSAK